MNAGVHITELLHILPKESIFAIEAYELSFTDDSTGNKMTRSTFPVIPGLL